MAAFTSKATGNWNAAGQTTWNEVGTPGAADTATIQNTHDVTVTANQACLGITINNGGELIINANVALTGMTANLAVSSGGTLTVADGCTLSFNDAGNNIALAIDGGTVAINGTSGNRCTVDNTGAGHVNINLLGNNSVLVADWLDTNKLYTFGANTYALCRDCEFSLVGWAVHDCLLTQATAILKRCFLAVDSNARRLTQLNAGVLYGHNVAFGYLRDGTSKPGQRGIYLASSALSPPTLQNVIINATTPILNTQDNDRIAPVLIDNYGYLDSDMLPDTGSALDGAVVGPGIGYRHSRLGTIERSTAAAKTGDYGERMTPDTLTNENTPLESSIYVPVTTGDNISVTIEGRRHTMTDDCAEIEIDPEGAWFTPTIKATTLTLDDTWYTFATAANCAEGPGIGGSGGSCWGSGSGPDSCGMVRIVLRLKEYQSGAYFDWADMVVTIT